MRLIIYLLSWVLVLVGVARADVSEMVLSDCFSQMSNNWMNRLTSKGNKFIANKNYNSVVEIDSDAKKSITYQLINLNSEYAEAKTFEKDGKIVSGEKHIADNWATLKMFYQSKTVEIIYYSKMWYRSGQKLNDNQTEVKEGSTWIYTCGSKSISK
jgi:hypothetical protein